MLPPKLSFRYGTLAVVLASCCAPHLAAQDAVKPGDVLRVWRQREEATRTVRIEMAGEFLTGKGPPKPSKENERRVVVIDGVKMRHERVTNVWNESINATLPETMTAVFDGQRKKSLHKRERADDLVHSKGWIYKAIEHPDSKNVYLAPIIHHFRPTSASFGAIDVDRLRVVSTAESVDGIPCILLEAPSADGLRLRKYWVAPDRDMSIVRCVGYFKDTEDLRIEVAFKRDARHGWQPARWSVMRITKGATALDSATTVVSASDLNIDIPADQFDLTFPPGTEVYDQIGRRSFVVKADSTIREILPSENARRAKYSEIMSTAPGDAGRQPEAQGASGSTVVIVAALGLLMACAIVLVVRRRRWWLT